MVERLLNEGAKAEPVNNVSQNISISCTVLSSSILHCVLLLLLLECVSVLLFYFILVIINIDNDNLIFITVTSYYL